MIPPAALVTGAARRIGRAIALDLARHGFDVAVHCRRSRSEADEVAGEIRSLGRRATILVAELGEAATPDALVEQAAAALGPIGLLVNNASAFEADLVGDLEPVLWERHMSVNLRAPVFLAQAFARLLPQGAEGVVVNIIDQRVWSLTPRFYSYTLSKAGLWTATQTLAQALAPRIRVVGLGPGPALMGERQTPEAFAAQARAVPLGRGPEIDEITAAVRFILATRSLTGQMIALDGGQHLAWETPDATLPE